MVVDITFYLEHISSATQHSQFLDMKLERVIYLNI